MGDYSQWRRKKILERALLSLSVLQLNFSNRTRMKDQRKLKDHLSDRALGHYIILLSSFQPIKFYGACRRWLKHFLFCLSTTCHWALFKMLSKMLLMTKISSALRLLLLQENNLVIRGGSRESWTDRLSFAVDKYKELCDKNKKWVKNSSNVLPLSQHLLFRFSGAFRCKKIGYKNVKDWCL